MDGNDELRRGSGSINCGPYQLTYNDQPRIAIVTTPFSGNNYLTWSNSIHISLATKDKLGFINGSIKKPTEDSADFAKWRRASYGKIMDFGVFTKDLAKSFIYCPTAKDLWNELGEIFGVGNDPQIYQIQRQINSMKQGNTSLSVYCNKLKKLWDDLNRLKHFPSCEGRGCDCGMSKKPSEMDLKNKTIQFLMGLNSAFDGVKNQMPNVNKAYAKLQTMESQKLGQKLFEESVEDNAMMIKSQNNNRATGNKGKFKKKDYGKREDRYCEHCKMIGHVKENYYSKWYIELMKNKKKKTAQRKQVNMVETPMDEGKTVDNKQ